jgi:DedD protein
MKLDLDERVKHRIVGIAVIVSVAVIFAPAVMKKSNQRLLDDMRVAVHLPDKPIPPKVQLKTESQVFQSIPVAHVNLPDVADDEEEMLVLEKPKMKALDTATRETAPETRSHGVTKPIKAPNVAATKAPIKKSAPKIKPVAVIHSGYTVQVANVAIQKNAERLVQTLTHRGFKATLIRQKTSKGMMFKVLVGQYDNIAKAKELKQQLALSMKLQGFITQVG